MATSAIFTKTVGKIVEEALRDARIIPVEQPVNNADYQRGIDALNNIVTHWQTQDINLWLKAEAVLPLVAGQRKYSLGVGGDECADADTFFNTTLTAAYGAADVNVTVASTTGMVSAPNILATDPTGSTQDWVAINSATLAVASGLRITNVGATQGGADYALTTTVGQTYRVRGAFTLGTSVSCVLSVLNSTTVEDTVTLAADGSFDLEITAIGAEIIFRAQNTSAVAGETSTIASLNYVDTVTGSRIGVLLTSGIRSWGYVLDVDSSTSVELVSALGAAAASGNTVYSYTTAIERPLRILQARYASSVTSSETPVNRWARSQYFDQPDKDSSGTVANWYYSPVLNKGELYVWQTASNANNILRLTYMRPALVYSDITDLLDFPSEFFIPLKWKIASEVGPSYGLPDNRQMVLEQKAMSTLEDALGHDTEMDSMSIQPDFR